MEKGFIFFVLVYILVQTQCVLSDWLREEVFASGNAQDDPPLKVEFFDPSDRYVRAGDEVQLDYTVNRPLIFGIMNSALMIRQRKGNGTVQSDTLADSAKLTEDGLPDFYDVDLDQDSQELTIHFKILEVRDIDEATFMVKAIDKKTNAEANTSLNIIILRESTKLQMKFGDSDFFSESINVPFSVDAGKYPVTCAAEGSNPATDDITIFWKGEKVPMSDLVVESMDTPVKRYRSHVTAEVDIVLADSGQHIECIAKSKAGNELHTKAPIKVNVYDPEVECTPGTAFVGKRYPVLSCTVMEEGYEIESYAYEFGKTGISINVGDQSAEYDEVIKTDLGDSKVKVDLKLHRVKDSHFSQYYLIITQTNGHITKVPVVLTEVEGPKDNSNIFGVSVATLTLCAVCALWKTL